MIQAIVVPLRRMPEKLQALDYLIPDELADIIMVGQLVTVPLRKKTEYGIVYSLASSARINQDKLKFIETIVAPEPMIPDKLLNFYAEISEFYRTPLGFVLKSAMPALQKTKLPKLNSPLAPNYAEHKNKPEFCFYHNRDDKKILLKQITEQPGQTLVLSPGLYLLPELKQIYSDIGCEVILLDDDSEKKYFKIWKQISEQDNLIVVATRKALFLPWKNLRQIIIDDEGAFEYKSWDMAPRYQTREAALSLAKFTGAKIFFLSPTPSVESYYFATNKVYGQSGVLQKYSAPAPIFADPNYEKRGGYNGVISEEVVRTIQEANSQTFIFLNRRGTSGGVICRDCGNIFRCSQCGRPLTLFGKTGELKCLYCKTNLSLRETCDKCGGANFSLLGSGIEGAADTLKKILPGREIVTVDKETNNIVAGDKAVIIGTEFAWARLDWQKISVLVFADPDAALVNSEFKSTENLWQKLRRAQTFANHGTKLFIQTKNPDHYVFRALYEPKIFYDEELKQRKIFEFPPFKYLTRLIISASSAAALEVKSAGLYRDLAALTSGRNDVKIYNPMNANPPVFKGEYKAIILVKADYATYKKTLKNLLARCPEDVRVDPNPNSVLSIN